MEERLGEKQKREDEKGSRERIVKEKETKGS